MTTKVPFASATPPSTPAPTAPDVPRPSVGRILHYSYKKADVPESLAVAFEGKVRPALVTGVNEDGTVNVQVFHDGSANGPSGGPGGIMWVGSVAVGAAPAPGAAHWPPRT
jgi:hypothetical protein